MDVKALGEESRGVYSGWLLLGVAVPLVCLAALLALPASVPAAALATVSYAASLALWQALFFISGKEVWYLSQYDMDLNPNYF